MIGRVDDVGWDVVVIVVAQQRRHEAPMVGADVERAGIGGDAGAAVALLGRARRCGRGVIGRQYGRRRDEVGLVADDEHGRAARVGGDQHALERVLGGLPRGVVAQVQDIDDQVRSVQAAVPQEAVPCLACQVIDLEQRLADRCMPYIYAECRDCVRAKRVPCEECSQSGLAAILQAYDSDFELRVLVELGSGSRGSHTCRWLKKRHRHVHRRCIQAVRRSMVREGGATNISFCSRKGESRKKSTSPPVGVIPTAEASGVYTLTT